MKRVILYMLILAVVWAVPADRVDVAKLRPVEVIAIYKKADVVLMMTDTEDVGVGSTAEAALENMRNASPAIIYLDTAEYLLIEDIAAGELEMIRRELKPSVRLCYVSGKVDLKDAAKFLPVHGDLPALRSWQPENSLPLLRSENGRLELSKNSKKGIDNG